MFFLDLFCFCQAASFESLPGLLALQSPPGLEDVADAEAL